MAACVGSKYEESNLQIHHVECKVWRWESFTWIPDENSNLIEAPSASQICSSYPVSYGGPELVPAGFALPRGLLFNGSL